MTAQPNPAPDPAADFARQAFALVAEGNRVPEQRVAQHDVETLADQIVAHRADHKCSAGCLAIALLEQGWSLGNI